METKSTLDERLIALGRERGFLTYGEVADALASAPNLERSIQRALRLLAAEGISLADRDAGERRSAPRHIVEPQHIAAARLDRELPGPSR